MARIRPLKNAPISEAMVDMRVVLAPEFRVDDFLRIKEKIGDEFPTVEPHRAMRLDFGLKSGQTVPAQSVDLGMNALHFRAADGRRIAQFRSDGFTYNQLTPYPGWESMRTHALRLWSLYREAASPKDVTRIAVRYINRIVFPEQPLTNLGRYLEIRPAIPKGAPRVITGWLQRLVLRDSDSGITTILTHALEPDVTPDRIVVILDVDVFVVRESGFREDEIESMLEQIRKTKNRVFFSCITEKLAERFE